MDAGAEETVDAYAGDRPGELLRVSRRGVSLLADGVERWHADHADIRSVSTVRWVRDGVVHDAVHVCAVDGRDRHFLVATTDVSNDYDAEFAEAVADALAAAVRRAGGLPR